MTTPLNLKVHKAYRTRDGRKVTILRSITYRHRTSYVVSDDGLDESYSVWPNGRIFGAPGSTHPRDLVAEWEDHRTTVVDSALDEVLDRIDRQFGGTMTKLAAAKPSLRDKIEAKAKAKARAMAMATSAKRAILHSNLAKGHRIHVKVEALLELLPPQSPVAEKLQRVRELVTEITDQWEEGLR